MAALDLLSRADDGFARRLALVRPGQWAAPTPCTEWDVRALVNHVVGATGAQLLAMRVLDIAVHTWDLARAIGAGESLDPDVVAFALTLRDTFDAARQRGAFALPSGEAPDGSSAQGCLLYLAGRRPG